MTEKLHSQSRIDLVDALRGFALMGIILIHNIDHFDLSNAVTSGSAFLSAMDPVIQKTIFFIFGGKSYAIFALVFGFSFYIQFENRRKRGEDFAGRFLWRMCLLFGFGIFHVMFYSGEILSVYALAGVLLIPLRNRSNRFLAILAIICMLEPWEMGKLIYAVCNPDYAGNYPTWEYYQQAVDAAKQNTSFFDTVKVNLHAGFLNAHIFAWYSGRYFQTFSLFLFGMLLGRKSLFIQSQTSDKFWKKAIIISLIAFIPLYALKLQLPEAGFRREILEPLRVGLDMWSNFAFMIFLVSSFVLLWFHTRVQSVQAKIIPYGRMSLSNYISSSMIGSIVYYNYGLGLYDSFGTTLSLLTGITVFSLQLLFSKWWLANHAQGPLEKLWSRLTWIKKKN